MHSELKHIESHIYTQHELFKFANNLLIPTTIIYYYDAFTVTLLIVVHL